MNYWRLGILIQYLSLSPLPAVIDSTALHDQILGYICGSTDALNSVNRDRDPIVSLFRRLNIIGEFQPKDPPTECADLYRWLEFHNLRLYK